MYTQKTDGGYYEVLPGTPIIGKLVRQGATIYRKSGGRFIYLVPQGTSHSAAWSQIIRA
jgi:hypothetical protein